MHRKLLKLADVLRKAGREALLYHGTPYQTAQKILQSGTLLATARKGDATKGVSLSRDWRVSQRFGDVIFGLDQTKLTQRYKITPYDYHGGNQNQGAGGGYYSQRSEAEEVVQGNITNLSSYLSTLFFSQQFMKQIEYWFRPGVDAESAKNSAKGLQQWLSMPQFDAKQKTLILQKGKVGFDAIGLGVQQQNPAQAHNFCTQCGAKKTPGQQFCTECGSPFAKQLAAT